MRPSIPPILDRVGILNVQTHSRRVEGLRNVPHSLPEVGKGCCAVSSALDLLSGECVEGNDGRAKNGPLWRRPHALARASNHRIEDMKVRDRLPRRRCRVLRAACRGQHRDANDGLEWQTCHNCLEQPS